MCACVRAVRVCVPVCVCVSLFRYLPLCLSLMIFETYKMPNVSLFPSASVPS